jgi:hypothetical protein
MSDDRNDSYDILSSMDPRLFLTPQMASGCSASANYPIPIGFLRERPPQGGREADPRLR